MIAPPVQRSGLLMASIDQRAGEALTDLIERTCRIPTFAAAVMVEDRIVLEHNADRPLCACSTFKVAAATAVMALVQEGLADLDRSVPEMDGGLRFSDPTAAKEITLRHLLSHTSGLDDTDQVRAGAQAVPGAPCFRRRAWSCLSLQQRRIRYRRADRRATNRPELRTALA